jgi:hypothetical protein
VARGFVDADGEDAAFDLALIEADHVALRDGLVA